MTHKNLSSWIPAFAAGLLIFAQCGRAPLRGEVIAGDTFGVSPETGKGRDWLLDLAADRESRQSGLPMEYARMQENTMDNFIALETSFLSQSDMLLRVRGIRGMDDRPTCLAISIPELKLPGEGAVEIVLECYLLRSQSVEAEKAWIAITQAGSPEVSLCSAELSLAGSALPDSRASVVFKNGTAEVSQTSISPPHSPLAVTISIKLKERSVADFEISSALSGRKILESFRTTDKLPEEIGVTAGVAAESAADEQGLADFRILSIQINK